MYTQPFPLRLERSQHVFVISCLLWLFSSRLECCACGKLNTFLVWKFNCGLFFNRNDGSNICNRVNMKYSFRPKAKFRGFPLRLSLCFLTNPGPHRGNNVYWLGFTGKWMPVCFFIVSVSWRILSMWAAENADFVVLLTCLIFKKIRALLAYFA